MASTTRQAASPRDDVESSVWASTAARSSSSTGLLRNASASIDPFGDEEDQTDGDRADEETVRCDNCYSTVEASASVCPACGANLESGWFS